MTHANTLPEAAGLAFDNLQVVFLENLLNVKIQFFCSESLPLFPDSQPNGRPVANWLTLFFSLGSQLPITQVALSDLTVAAEYLYRLCWMASFLQGAGLITNAQATQLLGNYNGAFS